MSKLLHRTATAVFAAVAAACLFSLATASPAGVEGRADAASQSCEKAFCLVSFF